MMGDRVFVMDRFGVGRAVDATVVRTEAWRVAEVRALGDLPDDVSPEIAPAPARGPILSEVPREVVMTDQGPRLLRSAPVGRNRIRIGDAFDVMEEQARRAWRGDEAAFDAPFCGGQIQAARDYAALVERLDASGVKCSSPETRLDGRGGGGLTVSEAVSRDMMRLSMLRRRIGDRLIKDKRRPSKGGRSAMRVRSLVDGVCLGGQTVGCFIEKHGWGRNQAVKQRFRQELAAALDRMRGYDLVVVSEGG